MIFDVYYPIRTKDKKSNEERLVPGTRPCPMEWAEIVTKVCDTENVRNLVAAHQDGDEKAKPQLPCVCFNGRCTTKYRSADAMQPTQLVMIDIDHCEDGQQAWQELDNLFNSSDDWKDFKQSCIMVAYLTPSKGLRLVAVAQPDCRTLGENIEWYNSKLELDRFGKVDVACKDFSRLSFLVPKDYILFENAALYLDTDPDFVSYDYLQNVFYDEEGAKSGKKKKHNDDVPQLTKEQIEEYKKVKWREQPVLPILERYLEVQGTPEEGDGEIHNYYNELVKYFRYLTANNKECLFAILPRFGHSAEECWDSLKSICRVNTLSKLPLDFYLFLLNNGFYRKRNNAEATALQEYMLSDDGGGKPLVIPYLPPIFKEFVKCAPKDFVVPAINALMAILGTLTSYVKAKYPYDHKWHTTSFFSIIIAPPSTGKGFVGAYMDLLFEDLRLRDFISQARENIYLSVINKKGANDKAPDKPKVSLRIIPPKNSEAEFLEKQSYNCGYHMFTYAAEMDSWAKGVRAAGGNKDDMIRIAWDNEVYGQQFKAANTFKGEVNLYWNVLITGTPKQIEKYFRDVENGLVTRCCFTPIENQEFVMAPKWKEMSKKDEEKIRAFMKRCDENSYEQPCNVDKSDIYEVADDAEAFDSKFDWHYRFKPRQVVDMSWIMPTIDNFQREQMKLGLKDVDKARDVFRRRVGVRGFRLALLCTQLYTKMNKAHQEGIMKFVDWWMHEDIDNMLKLWGTKYNKDTETAPNITQRSIYTLLNEEFSSEDVMAKCLQQGIKTPVRNIVSKWKTAGFIKKIGDKRYQKVFKDESK